MIGKLEADKEYFEKANPGFKCTGETLKVEYDTGEAATYVVFKGRYTPHLCVRDCGDHYTMARYSDYAHIDKETMEVTIDLEDR